MNSSKYSQKVFYLAFGFFFFIFIYMALVAADFLLGRMISKGNEAQITDAKIIERNRAQYEDTEFRKIAIRDGYKPLFYPEAVDNYHPLKKLAQDLQAAPLAPQPNSKLYFLQRGVWSDSLPD